MSGTSVNTQAGAGDPPGDPSMADILASIRRILSEDEPASPKLPDPPPKPTLVASRQHTDEVDDEDVLVLDDSMLVEAPAAAEPRVNEPAAMRPVPTAVGAARESAGGRMASSDSRPAPDPDFDEPASSPTMAAAHEAPVEPPAPQAAKVVVPPPLPEGVSHRADWPQATPALAEPITVATAASSLVNLVRSVAAERTASIQRNGLSIEDVVREEVRPLLKAWLDMHLPPLVERLVQAEIERVVSRAAS